MARIKINDLPKDQKISKEEMKFIMGGINPQPSPMPIPPYYDVTRITSSYLILNSDSTKINPVPVPMPRQDLVGEANPQPSP